VSKRTLREYQSNSLENRRKFDSWLKANAILGFVLFLGMMAMAVATVTTSHILKCCGWRHSNPCLGSARGDSIVR